MKYLVSTLIILILSGCSEDRSLLTSANKYELRDKQGMVYFAGSNKLVCQDALARLKTCNFQLANEVACYYNENYSYGMSVDNIACKTGDN